MSDLAWVLLGSVVGYLLGILTICVLVTARSDT